MIRKTYEIEFFYVGRDEIFAHFLIAFSNMC